ncbi:MAG TPA: aminotransferase class V-fold PLP-dependent enzyme [Vicinamibacteria bacterium]|nr:aminotransferase class V-fold PLP-dependent enzyme [Vicinamibacteria bacterium]
MTPEAFRSRFPIFQRKVFLNSCSKGALGDSVEAAYAEYLHSWKSFGSPWEEWVEVLERARARFAAFMGCSADELALTFCASTAVGSLASALSFDGARNRVLLDDFEFPTVAHNWLVQQKRGAEIVRLRGVDDRMPPGSIEQALDERVLLVPVSHVCYRNGYRQDLGAVVEAIGRVGAYSFVDDYQSTGTRPLDVTSLGCDFLVSGALKYLLGSSGLAFLYVRREHIERLEPLLTGWFGQERPFDFDIERATYHPSARRFETGTPPVPNLYAALAGLSLIEEVGAERIAAHVERLASDLIDGAKSRGFRVLTPEEPESRGPLVVIGCGDSQRIVEALAAENIVVSARGTGLRVSFHYYNLPEDVDALLSGLERYRVWMD